ncbi:hypothetical protein MRB53_027980 [Persea americana]|uniref:Uncharacterized protein n=1 Tax=Persea americana TaxID=3435 RepID=A0ACC2KEB3_PERAE|nr:hypothetical protein MRB53_027980 [Persea americana]
MRKTIMPASGSNSPPTKKKRRRCLRSERIIAPWTQKKKRKHEELIEILIPTIRKVVRTELKRQSPPSVPRSPVNQIQASNVISPQLQFKNPLPHTLYANSTDISFEVAIRIGEENVVTGPLSSIRVKLMVLSGDFEKEYWTKKEFKEKVVSPRKGKGPLLMGKVVIALEGGVGTFNNIKIRDNSSWTSSGSFRLGLKGMRSNSVQERILEARSEAFVVKDPRGELSQKRDYPLLADKTWRLKNIRENGVYFRNLKDKGIKTVQEFLQAYNLDAPSLLKNLVEDLKEQAKQNREGIIKYNGQPSFTPTPSRLPELHEVASIEAASFYWPNAGVIIQRNELATANSMHHSIRAPLSEVMTNTQSFGQMHSNNLNLLAASRVQQQEARFLQNFQAPQAFTSHDQDNTFSASNLTDNLQVPATMFASHENFFNLVDQNANTVNETVNASFHQPTAAWSTRKAPNLS